MGELNWGSCCVGGVVLLLEVVALPGLPDAELAGDLAGTAATAWGDLTEASGDLAEVVGDGAEDA